MEDRRLVSQYVGTEKIFHFLQVLNDLVRLCTTLNIDFPFDSYSKYHQMPLVNIEFASLKNFTHKKAHLVLLDTHGPNEDGQTYLRTLLKDQLNRASAVLAVLDYTQLKSDADAEMRQQLKETAKIAGGSMYALINKFDQKDRNGDSFEQVKQFVASQLLEGIIREEAIFPVSSRWAYLSSRALDEYARYNCLPDPNVSPWVADFGEEALGRRWKDKISDPAQVLEAAEVLWNDSQFTNPLENVIQSAYSQATLLAVKSVADKLNDSAARVDNFLNIRQMALGREAGELQMTIDLLLEDIDRICACEREIYKTIEAMLEALAISAQAEFAYAREELEGVLDRHFLKESSTSPFREQPFLDRKDRSRSKEFTDPLSKLTKTMLPQRLDVGTACSVENDVLRFNSERSSKEFISAIEDKVSRIVDYTDDYIYQIMEELIDDFEAKATQALSKALVLIEDIQQRLFGEGFDIQLKVPLLNYVALQLSAEDMFSNLVVRHSSTEVQRYRKQNIWGTLCRFIGTSEWGWSSNEVEENRYEIELSRVRNNVFEGLADLFDDLGESIVEYVQRSMNDSVTELFSTLKQYVDDLREDLIQSCRDREKSQQEQMLLLEQLAMLQQQMPIEDCKLLKETVVTVIDAEQIKLQSGGQLGEWWEKRDPPVSPKPKPEPEQVVTMPYDHSFYPAAQLIRPQTPTYSYQATQHYQQNPELSGEHEPELPVLTEQSMILDQELMRLNEELQAVEQSLYEEYQQDPDSDEDTEINRYLV